MMIAIDMMQLKLKFFSIKNDRQFPEICSYTYLF